MCLRQSHGGLTCTIRRGFLDVSTRRCGDRRIGTARHPCAAAAARRRRHCARDLDRPAPADDRLAEAESDHRRRLRSGFRAPSAGCRRGDPLRLHHQRRRALGRLSRGQRRRQQERVSRRGVRRREDDRLRLLDHGLRLSCPVIRCRSSRRRRACGRPTSPMRLASSMSRRSSTRSSRSIPDIAISRIRANVLMGRRMQHLLGDRAADRLDTGPRWRIRCRSSGTRTSPIFWCSRCGSARGAPSMRRRTSCCRRRSSRRRPVPRRCGRGVCCLPSTPGSTSSCRGLNLHLLSDPSWATRTRAPLIGSSETAKRELGWSPRYPTAVSVVQHFRDVSPWRLDVWLLLVLWMLGRATRNAPGSLAGRSGRLFLCLNGSGRRRFLADGRGRHDAGARRGAAVADQHGDDDRDAVPRPAGRTRLVRRRASPQVRSTGSAPTPIAIC